MKTFNKILATLFIGALWASCNGDYDPHPNKPDTQGWGKTHTIQELIAEFASEKGDFFPVRVNSGTANLYSVDSIRRGGDDIVIEGIVISSDTAGNVYKSFFIQDMESPEQGLKISVDAAALSGIMPLGQKVSIKCNGLAIGKYAEMYQLGMVYFNNADTLITAEKNKRGYEPGRIPYHTFLEQIKFVGLPDISKIVVHTMTVREILNSGSEVHARIVRINGVNFTGKDQGQDIPEGQNIFAIDTKGVGYPSSRDITDGTGTIAIATSEFARFSGKKIPGTSEKFDVIALVGWYRDKSNYPGNWQLTIRSLSDLILVPTPEPAP